MLQQRNQKPLPSSQEIIESSPSSFRAPPQKKPVWVQTGLGVALLTLMVAGPVQAGVVSVSGDSGLLGRVNLGTDQSSFDYQPTVAGDYDQSDTVSEGGRVSLGGSLELDLTANRVTGHGELAGGFVHNGQFDAPNYNAAARFTQLDIDLGAAGTPFTFSYDLGGSQTNPDGASSFLNWSVHLGDSSYWFRYVTQSGNGFTGTSGSFSGVSVMDNLKLFIDIQLSGSLGGPFFRDYTLDNAASFDFEITSGSVAAVPLPASLPLLAGGLLALGVVAGYRRPG